MDSENTEQFDSEKIIEVMPDLAWLTPALSYDQLIKKPRLNQISGTILGAAMGDAMGHPTEFIGSIEGIYQRYGKHGVQHFELYWQQKGKRFAPYTDDTQMAEIVLRTLLWSKKYCTDLETTMEMLAKSFIHWSKNPQGGHRAPGNACLSGCHALSRGVHWSIAGGADAGGCGSVMRAYPFGLIFYDDIEKAEHWAVEHSKLTHRDPIALAACAAMAVGIVYRLRGANLDPLLKQMVAAAERYCQHTAKMMRQAIAEAQSGVLPTVTLERLEAWAAHEAIAATVYILARHPDDPQKAILEGANTKGDSDSIATLAGAMVSAKTGLSALPRQWFNDIERSTVFCQLAAATETL